MYILWKLIDKIKRLINPIKYWKNKGLIVGTDCEIYRSASFGSEPYLITLGNHVRVNDGVNFITHDGGVWVLREYLKISNSEKIDLFGRIIIGNNVHIGTNAIIMPNVTIGDNCIIGCGAIVTKNIPNNSIVIGVPARVIKTIDEYTIQHIKEFDYTKYMSDDEKKDYLLKKYKNV